MDIAAESDESRSLVRVAIWAWQNAHDPGLYSSTRPLFTIRLNLSRPLNGAGLYSEEAFIRGNTVHVYYVILYTLNCRSLPPSVCTSSSILIYVHVIHIIVHVSHIMCKYIYMYIVGGKNSLTSLLLSFL